MTWESVICACLRLTVTVSLCSLAATADNTACGAATKCTATCNASPCQVDLIRTANSINIALHGHAGSDASILCVQDGTKVMWATPDAKSYFAIVFEDNTPFSANILVGTSADPVSDTANDQDCYVYSVKVCKSKAGCQTWDPKVIVTGAGPLKINTK